MTVEPHEQVLTAQEQVAVWVLADEAIRAHLARRRPDVARIVSVLPATSALHRPGCAFVTIRRRGELLGCIGSLEPTRSLCDDVVANAVAAATTDPRFPPVTPEQYAAAEVEVSVLGPTAPLAVRTFDELLAVLRPGVDGLVIDDGRHRATFLPAVWDQLPDPAAFCAHLWRKAGLPPGSWPPALRVERYAALEVHPPNG